MHSKPTLFVAIQIDSASWCEMCKEDPYGFSKVVPTELFSESSQKRMIRVSLMTGIVLLETLFQNIGGKVKWLYQTIQVQV